MDKLPNYLQKSDLWAKCDCIASVSFDRLDRVKAGKCPNTGRRLYESPKVYSEDMKQLKLCLANHLGLSDLIYEDT
jgi:uncharacterized protein YifN (PemK superfamily)